MRIAIAIAVLLLAGLLAATAITSCAVADAQDAEQDKQQDEAEVADTPHEIVILVHGMGRTPASMSIMEWSLEREGYEVVNWGYSSVCCSLTELGDQLANQVEVVSTGEPDRIHFVGHSLGNLLIRYVLHHAPPEQSGRVVMLAPPNRGSEMADTYAEWFGWLLEPLPDLTTDEDSTARSLPPVDDRELGIIAGQFDGKVDVDETHQDTAEDHRVISATHTFIMNRPDTQQLTVDFLRRGHFAD